MALSHHSISATDRVEDRLHRSKERWTAVLIVSAGLGTLCGFAGLVMTAEAWLFAGPVHVAGKLGTVLVVAFFPLLILAAHSLDRIRDADTALRFERFKKRMRTDLDGLRN